jgi:hypothetical protein
LTPRRTAQHRTRGGWGTSLFLIPDEHFCDLRVSSGGRCGTLAVRPCAVVVASHNVRFRQRECALALGVRDCGDEVFRSPIPERVEGLTNLQSRVSRRAGCQETGPSGSREARGSKPGLPPSNPHVLSHGFGSSRSSRGGATETDLSPPESKTRRWRAVVDVAGAVGVRGIFFRMIRPNPACGVRTWWTGSLNAGDAGSLAVATLTNRAQWRRSLHANSARRPSQIEGGEKLNGERGETSAMTPSPCLVGLARDGAELGVDQVLRGRGVFLRPRVTRASTFAG